MFVLRAALTLLAVPLALACAGAGLLALGGAWSTRLDILTHLAPIYLVGGVAAAALTMLGLPSVRRGVLVLSAVAMVASAILIVPEFFRPLGRLVPPGSPGEITVIQFNAWRGNRQLPRVADWLDAQRADFILVEEARPQLRELMRARGWAAAGAATTVMIFSREPYLEMRRPHPATRWAATWVNATYANPGGPIELVVTHEGWPTTAWRDGPDSGLRQVVKDLPRGRMILAGDFNSAPWSFRLRRLDAALGLIRRDRATSTWPAQWPGVRPRPAPFPFLPIDHLYAGADWATVAVRRGPNLGSDHYPLIVTLAPAPR